MPGALDAGRRAALPAAAADWDRAIAAALGADAHIHRPPYAKREIALRHQRGLLVRLSSAPPPERRS